MIAFRLFKYISPLKRRWSSKIMAFVLATLALFLSLLLIPVSNADNNHEKRALKLMAAYMYNFVNYTEWPQQSFKKDETLTIGILGRDPFGDVFDRVEGSYIRGKRLVIRRFLSSTYIHDCHMLFIDRSAKEPLKQILTSANEKNVLTISDIDGFAASGGIVEFYYTDNNIRFKINVTEANQSNLKISSKILELATIVK